MNSMKRTAKHKLQQRGATLIVGLIFLVALTLLGVMAMKSTLLQERMAGGSRDHSLAFQAAEAALRDAKRDIKGIRANGSSCPPMGGGGCRNPLQSGPTGYAATCPLGLCYDNPCTPSPVNYAFGAGPHITFPMTGPPSIAYGRFTGATPIAFVAAQPRYLIEYFTRPDATNLLDVCAGADIPIYRITARGVGVNPNTVVTLQEVFAP